MITYLIFVGTLAGIYALLALGLVMSWGQGGMTNLGLVGFYGLGAYTSAILVGAGTPMALGWLAATVVAGAVGAAVCLVTRTLRGDYLAIITLGFAEVVRLLELNETWLTGGSDGISGIPAPFKGTFGTAYPLAYLGLTWLLVLIAALLLARLLRSPFGRALRAVRDDEQVAAVAGKSVLALKVKAFSIGAALSGLAGALYAHFTSFIAPDSFVVQMTIYIFLAVTAGGVTRVSGAIVGAVGVMTLLEGSRFLAAAIPAFDAVQVASIREFAIAVALIVVMQIRPGGAFASRNQLSGRG
jgi:branched-chain amino acid transport system permease protein